MKKGALLLGYARVSKGDDQDTDAQVKALRQAGCKRIFEEKASGGRWHRPELHKALGQLREGRLWKNTKGEYPPRKVQSLFPIASGGRLTALFVSKLIDCPLKLLRRYRLY